MAYWRLRSFNPCGIAYEQPPRAAARGTIVTIMADRVPVQGPPPATAERRICLFGCPLRPASPIRKGAPWQPVLCRSCTIACDRRRPVSVVPGALRSLWSHNSRHRRTGFVRMLPPNNEPGRGGRARLGRGCGDGSGHISTEIRSGGGTPSLCPDLRVEGDPGCIVA